MAAKLCEVTSRVRFDQRRVVFEINNKTQIKKSTSRLGIFVSTLQLLGFYSYESTTHRFSSTLTRRILIQAFFSSKSSLINLFTDFEFVPEVVNILSTASTAIYV